MQKNHYVINEKGQEVNMPAKSEKQRRFMGAELSRKRRGKKTRTGMSESSLEDFVSKKISKRKPRHEQVHHQEVLTPAHERIGDALARGAVQQREVRPRQDTVPMPSIEGITSQRTQTPHNIAVDQNILEQRRRKGDEPPRRIHRTSSPAPRGVPESLEENYFDRKKLLEEHKAKKPRDVQRKLLAESIAAIRSRAGAGKGYRESEVPEFNSTRDENLVDATKATKPMSPAMADLERLRQTAPSEEQVKRNVAEKARERRQKNKFRGRQGTENQSFIKALDTVIKDLEEPKKNSVTNKIKRKVKKYGRDVGETMGRLSLGADEMEEKQQSHLPHSQQTMRERYAAENKRRNQKLAKPRKSDKEQYLNTLRKQQVSSKDLLPKQDTQGNFIPNETIPFTPDLGKALSLAADAIQTHIVKDDDSQDTRWGRRNAKQDKKRRGRQKMKTRQGSRDQWNQRMRATQEKKRKEQ